MIYSQFTFVLYIFHISNLFQNENNSNLHQGSGIGDIGGGG
jgi:hypothetical protein